MSDSPHLNKDQLNAVKALLNTIRNQLTDIAQGDRAVLHHARRYIKVRLEHDERDTPAKRNKLKFTLMTKQRGICALCPEPLPDREAELDRKDPILGYTEENCRLIHHECHRKSQKEKQYK